MSISLKGSSRQSLVTTRAAFEKIISTADARVASELSADLFAIAQVLDSSIALRRALTDYARDAVSKAALSKEVLHQITARGAFTLFSSMVGLRWSSPRDLADVVEVLGVEAESAATEKSSQLELLESEIFGFAQIVSKNPDLRAIFADRTTGSLKKSDLVSTLLSGKALNSTISLISFLVDHPRGRNLENGLTEFAEIISARKDRSIAHVISAGALTSEQISRLTQALAKMTGKDIRVNVSVESDVVGGLSIQIGDELIDGTMATRLTQADRLLAGKSA
jgi:F-type H+-transporting ATPase subunit delta